MSDAIEVLKKWKDDVVEYVWDISDNNTHKEFSKAFDEALLALEQKEKFIKILRDIDYFLDNYNVIEAKGFIKKWMKELEGVGKMNEIYYEDTDVNGLVIRKSRYKEKKFIVNWNGFFYYLEIPIFWLFEKTYIFLYGKEQFKRKFCKKELKK